MISSDQRPDPPLPMARARRGRWLGGVCAGLAPPLGVAVVWLRLAFVLASGLAGVGVALYLACWLIIPAQGNGESERSARGIVVFAIACAVCAGLALLAGLSALATLFGFGWAVVGAAAMTLVGVVLGARALGPAWALLPVAALTLPAIAVATAGLKLTPELGTSVLTPGDASQLRSAVYRSGLGTLLIDLRHTALPGSGELPVRIEAGVRRTIVALPENRCVHVVVHYDVNPFVAQLGALVTGRVGPLFSDVVLFGRDVQTSWGPGTADGPSGSTGPLLRIDFSSQGGSLYVRDYPDAVDPNAAPNWPGFVDVPEPPPYLGGVKRALARTELAAWRVRFARELDEARTVDALLPGPCGPRLVPFVAPRVLALARGAAR